MNGRVAKKVREKATINVYKAYVGFTESLMKLPFRKRLKFCYSVLFKKVYKPR